MLKKTLLGFVLTGALLANVTAHAGPVIIAGTDADDHGFTDGTNNLNGWLFMERAFENLGAAVTNGNLSVVCIGCNAGGAFSAFDSATAKSNLSGTWSFSNVTSATDITNFFNGTGATNVGNTGILYMPTTTFNVGGGIDDTQLAIVNANSAILSNYVVGGGGLFTQEQITSTIGYGWLTTLLPGLVVNSDSNANSSVLNLTAAGTAAFPGLTDADASNGTPWHAWFSGNLGGLATLITGPIFDPNGGTFPGAVVIGGGPGTVFNCGDPGQPPCENGVPEPASLVILGLGLAGLAQLRRRKAK